MTNRQFIEAIQALQKPDAANVQINGEDFDIRDIDYDPTTDTVTINTNSYAESLVFEEEAEIETPLLTDEPMLFGRKDFNL